MFTADTFDAIFKSLNNSSQQAVSNEIEYCFYVLVDQVVIEQLLNDAEKNYFIEQAELPVWNPTAEKVVGRVRARRTHGDAQGSGQCYMNIKGSSITVDGGATRRPESDPIEIDPATFDLFKSIASSTVRKRRLEIPVTLANGSVRTWELDIHMKTDGSYSEWVKVDLELPDETIPLPAFPYQGRKRVAATEDGVSVVDPAVIDMIFREEYTLYNNNVWARPEKN